MAAVNSVGTGPQSVEATATPQPTAPSAPLGLKASGRNGSINLSWSVPATDGGSPITGYNVYRGTASGGESSTPLATGLTTTSYTDSTVTNGTTYYYTVAAVNAVGTSPQSSETKRKSWPPPAAPFGRNLVRMASAVSFALSGSMSGLGCRRPLPKPQRA